MTVELRPPRSGLTRGGAMDMWIDLSHAIRGLAVRDAFLMLTDSAVGEEEEENLQHLTANLANEVEPWRVVPFLTCLHPARLLPALCRPRSGSRRRERHGNRGRQGAGRRALRSPRIPASAEVP